MKLRKLKFQMFFFFIQDNTWQTRPVSTTQHQPTLFLKCESSKANKEKPGSGNTNGRGEKNILNYNQENSKKPNFIYKEAAKGELRSLQFNYKQSIILFFYTFQHPS